MCGPGNARSGVRPHADDHPCFVIPAQVAALELKITEPRGAPSRPPFDLLAHPLDLAGQQRLAQPREVFHDQGVARQIRDGPDFGVLPDQRHVFLIDVPITNRVCKAVDAGPQDVLGVREGARRTYMRNDPHSVRVRFVDDGP